MVILLRHEDEQILAQCVNLGSKRTHQDHQDQQ
ncbi:MAG: hypothetical protein ACI9TA_002279 [Reinekea sp.]